MNYIIETKSLSYNFEKFKALENLDLQVPPNSIYGFLGPNGAGKTTTIKIILGLLKSKANNVFLFNKLLNKNRIEILSKTGTLLENSSLYGHLTAAENLKITTTLIGIKEHRIDEVLKITGLQHVKHKKVSQFSMGMKQRLGISRALLSDPELIILDEPTNGLDPAGIIEIRNLIINLKEKEGKTIFLSSHLLSEIEKMCTNVGIINRGKLLFQGKMDDLEQINNPSLQIRCSKPDVVAKYLSERNFEFETENDHLFKILSKSDFQTATIVRELVNQSVDIYGVESKKMSLEELFIKITELK